MLTARNNLFVTNRGRINKIKNRGKTLNTAISKDDMFT